MPKYRLGVLYRVLIFLAALWLTSAGGWSLLWLLLLPFLAWDIVKQFRPTESTPPPAQFNEPGEYRVVLQVTGPKLVHVVRELRRTRHLGLKEAKDLTDAAPVVVAEGLSQQSAELVADRLRAAGARALAAPIGEM
jgi:hypothetical protein